MSENESYDSMFYGIDEVEEALEDGDDNKEFNEPNVDEGEEKLKAAFEESQPSDEVVEPSDEVVKSGEPEDKFTLVQNITERAGNTGRKYAQVLSEKSPAQRRRMPKGVRFP